MIGTDQRITSGPAARTAASRGRIHDCTRIVSRKVRFFSLAPRAPSIHGPTPARLDTVRTRERAVPETDSIQNLSGMPLPLAPVATPGRSLFHYHFCRKPHSFPD